MRDTKTGITRPINWNDVQDPYDLLIWNRLIGQFWVPEAIPVAGDQQDWARFTDDEKRLTERVFTGLTMLDTLQSTMGAPSLVADSVTPMEESVYANITFMEAVHAKSYSYVFSTLCTTEEINAAFDWSEENSYLQRKAEIIESHYEGMDPLKRKIASTLLESFLFYSGFYLPLYWSTRGKLTNTADLVRLIIRDEAVHGAYIGYKYQVSLRSETLERQAELYEFTITLLTDLYENEVLYTRGLYDSVGLSEDVTKFLRYNANRALMNLGYEALFPEDSTRANPAVIAALDLGSESHDFFSGKGSSYSIVVQEEMKEKDWD